MLVKQDTPHYFDKSLSSKLKLTFKDGFQLIKVCEVIYCKSEGNYTRFFLSNGGTALTSKTLGVYEQQLCQFGFFRVHKSFLVNLNHVYSFNSRGRGGKITMSNNQTVELSKDIKKSFFNSLNKFHI